MSAESEVSYSKVSGTEVSKINPRFMYALSMLYLPQILEKCLK